MFIKIINVYINYFNLRIVW